MPELTEKEHKALVFLVQDGMSVIGADEPKELLIENQTWFNRRSLSMGNVRYGKQVTKSMSILQPDLLLNKLQQKFIEEVVK